MSTQSQWVMDVTHSSAEFEVQHMVISTYRGRFRRMEGKFSFDDENPNDSHLEVSFDPKSLDTEDKGLFDKLMGEEFFDAEKHPRFTYRSTAMRKTGEKTWHVDGELTIRGITQKVPLEVEEAGGGNNPFARKPMKGFKARASFDRGDYGMKWNFPLDTGAKYLGEKVSVYLQIELLKIA